MHDPDENRRRGQQHMSLRISDGLIKAAKEHKQVERLKARSNNEMKNMSKDFQSRVVAVLNHLHTKGWVPVVYHSKRTRQEQAQKVASGASKTMNSFHVEGSKEQRHGYGMHLVRKGEAADIVDARYLWNGPCKDLGHQFWKDLGSYAKAQGLEWGGDWKSFKDVAHIQLIKAETTDDIKHIA